MSNEYLKMLETLADEDYKKFHQKLIPNIDEYRVLGVRTPKLRALAKKIKNTDLANEFLASLPHKYYEENNLHAFLLEDIRDFDEAIKRVEEFLPFVDNWATCDGMKIKVFRKNPHKLLPYIKKWLKSNDVYTVRFAIVMLLSVYLDENFDKSHYSLVCGAICDEYYINMAVAWYFSFALIKQYDSAVKLFENKQIKNKWVHNKSLQKAIESFRINEKSKQYLKSLKIKWGNYYEF